MLSKHAVVFDPNDIICIVRVVFFQMKQDFKFDSGLVLEFLLVSDNLESHNLFGLMIDTFESLSKGSLTKEVKDLKPVCDMIL